MVDLLINIDVDDLSRATAFYTDAFDLRIGRRFGDGGIELLGGSSPIYLLVKAAGTEATSHSNQRRDYSRHWTPVHLDIVVQDIDAAIERALKAGAKLERAAQAKSWGKIALLADPFGNGFCLVEFLGRGYDEIASS
jgi:predicted enzyme related to lactoylglutathione lyase